MAAYKRVFRQFPGFDVIGNIESVNVIDLAPPGQVLGSGTGNVLLVAEFENGPVETPFQVFGPNDLLTKAGGLGHAANGNPHAGCVAVKSGGDELWNGNGFVWLRNKAFSGLILCRVDNSSGSVQFSRLACLLGPSDPVSVANGGTVEFTRNGSVVVTATFSGSAAQVDGAAGTYPTLFVGGETLEIKDGDDAPRVVVFTAADQTIGNVVDRINAVLAKTVASNNGGELRLSSSILGGDGYIEAVGGTARATLGLPTAVVQQVDNVLITSNTGGGDFTVRVAINVNGVVTNYDGTYNAAGGDSVTVIRDALLAALQLLAIPGVTIAALSTDQITITGNDNVVFTTSIEAEPDAADATASTTTPAVVLAAFGLGNVPNLAAIEPEHSVLVFDALTGISADVNVDGLTRVCNSGTPGTGTLQATGGTELATFGFASTLVDAAAGEDVTIPAGTRIQDATATGTIWVTMKDIETGTGGGSFDAKVRPWTDDDTALASSAGDVTLLLDELPDGFSVTNAAGITRLSASQLDARYKQALDATLSEASVAKQSNMIACARSSASIMRYLKSNALTATANGLAARKAITRPPLATTRVEAKSATGVGVAAPGIARDERVFYCFPGATTQIPEIQSVGAAVGGLGFTDDGIIEVGADGFYASVRSQIPPEENAGQALSDTNVQGGGIAVLSLQDAFNPDVAGGVGLQLADYISFRDNGIIALNSNATTGFFFQSDVTSVHRASDLSKAPAERRFMADFLIDTFGDIGLKYVKKLGKPERRRALQTELRGFLRLLQSPNTPSTSRLRSYQIIDETQDDQFALGFVVLNIKVVTYPAMLSIALITQVGPNVVIEEAA